MAQGVLVEWQGQEVVAIYADHAGPAQVIAHPNGVDVIGEAFEAAEVTPVDGIGATDGQRDPVQDDGVALSDLADDPSRPSAGVHEILRDRFKPVYSGPLRRDVAEVVRAQTDPQAQAG